MLVTPPDKAPVDPLFITACGSLLFLYLCSIGKPDVSGHRLIAFCLTLLDAELLFFKLGRSAPFFVLFVPLTLIWFADYFSAFRGNMGRGGIVNVATPDWMVAGFGWILLLLLSGSLLTVFFA